MEITEYELMNKISNGDKMVVDFYAPWCGPCKIMKPTFDKLSQEYEKENHDVRLYSINVEDNTDLAVKLGVRAVPTIISFKGSNVVNKISGLLNEDGLKKLVKELS